MPAEYNPANAQMRMGWEDTPGVVPLEEAGGLDKDMRFVSETLSADHTKVEDDSISAGGQREPGDPSKITVGGTTTHRYRLEEQDWFLYNAQGWDTPSTLEAGVEQHILTPEDPGSGVASPETYCIERHRDDGEGQLFHGVRSGGGVFTLAQPGILQFVPSHVAERVSYWGDAAVETEIGIPPSSANTLRLRNYPPSANWFPVSVDGDIYIKVTDIGASPVSVTCQAKIGSAATFPAETVDNVFELIFGVDVNGDAIWTDVLDANTEAIIGTRDLPVQAFAAAVTGYEVGDIFVIPRDRALWTVAYPAVSFLNEVYADVIIDGTVFCLDQLTLTIVTPVVARFCIGGRFAKSVFRRGKRVVSGSVNRQYLTTELRKHLERGTNFQLDLRTFTGDKIGSTNFEHGLRLYSPKCIPSGPTVSVTGSETMPEIINFDCHPDPTDPGGEGFVDDLTVILTNTIADLTA